MKRKIVGIIAMLLIGSSLLLTACRKNNDKPAGNEVITITPTPTVTIIPTEEPKVITPTIAPTEAVKPNISEEEAIKSILKIIGERGYFIESLNNNLTLNKSTYYVFQVSDSGEVIHPNIIVDKMTGDILCFYADGTTAPFSEYPLYTDVEATPAQTVGGFTKEDALKKLEGMSQEALGLVKNLSEYTIVYDNWTSFAGGKQCYGINVYTGTGTDTDFVGTYYVAVDGSGIYIYDITLDDFKEIK